MKSNSNLLKLITISAAISCTSLLSGCSSDLFDSSVGPDGKKNIDVQTTNVQTKKTVKRKPQKPAVQQPQALEESENSDISENVARSFNEDVKAGVVKPYVPEAQENTGTLLPTIESLKGKTNDNPLAKITVDDVLSGNVSLNNINNTNPENSSTQESGSNVQVSLPAAFEPRDTPQNLKPISEVASVAAPQVEVVDSLDNQSIKNSLGSATRCSNDESSEKAQQTTYNLAGQQASRLKNESGPVYIAPTVITGSVSSCIRDLSPVINQAFKQNGVQTVVGTGVDVSQNSGSSTVIPSLIRACKQNGIPLLNVSVVRTIGQKTVITIRNIRVKDGITLVQNTTQL